MTSVFKPTGVHHPYLKVFYNKYCGKLNYCYCSCCVSFLCGIFNRIAMNLFFRKRVRSVIYDVPKLANEIISITGEKYAGLTINSVFINAVHIDGETSFTSHANYSIKNDWSNKTVIIYLNYDINTLNRDLKLNKLEQVDKSIDSYFVIVLDATTPYMFSSHENERIFIRKTITLQCKV